MWGPGDLGTGHQPLMWLHERPPPRSLRSQKSLVLMEKELAHQGVGAGPTAIQPLAWQGWRNPAFVSGDSLASYPRPSASTGGGPRSADICGARCRMVGNLPVSPE